MPRCADESCGRWRPERLAPKWASGIRMNGWWYCSRECVELAIRAGLDASQTASVPVNTMPPLRLGVLLRHLGTISDAQLTSALESQRKSGRRLGAELKHRQDCTPEVLLKALAAQSGAGYITSFDIERVRKGPAWLPAETVRALRLIPFATHEKERTVRVACTAPVPRAAMRALFELTGWTAEPFLVDDETWDRALEAYRSTKGGTSDTGETVNVRDVATAAARIADTALADRAITMRHAKYERLTWVRVEGPRHLSDLLITRAEEEPCQAALIAH